MLWAISVYTGSIILAQCLLHIVIVVLRWEAEQGAGL